MSAPTVHRVSGETCSRCGCKGQCTGIDRVIAEDTILVCSTCVAAFTAAAAEPWYLPAAELNALEHQHRDHYRLVRFTVAAVAGGEEPMRWMEGSA